MYTHKKYNNTKSLTRVRKEGENNGGRWDREKEKQGERDRR